MLASLFFFNYIFMQFLLGLLMGRVMFRIRIQPFMVNCGRAGLNRPQSGLGLFRPSGPPIQLIGYF